MTSLLNVDRVRYECDCGDWFPLCRLYYCRHCAHMRCPSCAATEIDCMFCPNCLENIPLSEARVKRNRCFNCNSCPICSMTLAARACGDTHGTYLTCATCKWSTRDSSTPDQPTAINWPVYENPLDSELNNVLEQMKNFEIHEKAQRDQNKFSKRRSNVGSMFSDRFGLQIIYQKRKQAMEQPKKVAEPHLATDEIAELGDSFFSTIVDTSKITTLDSLIMQPLTGERSLGPIHMQLRARKAIRCRGCDHNLCKLDYSPSSIKYKIQYFARNYVPELRLSRETKLIVGQVCPVFLTLYNESGAKADVILIGDPQEGCVECLTPVVETILPNLDDTADVYFTDSERIQSTGHENIVFRKRNSVGIRLDVCVTESLDENILSLVIKYKNELSVMPNERPVEWKIVKLRVTLGKS